MRVHNSTGTLRDYHFKATPMCLSHDKIYTSVLYLLLRIIHSSKATVNLMSPLFLLRTVTVSKTLLVHAFCGSVFTTRSSCSTSLKRRVLIASRASVRFRPRRRFRSSSSFESLTGHEASTEQRLLHKSTRWSQTLDEHYVYVVQGNCPVWIVIGNMNIGLSFLFCIRTAHGYD